MARHGDRVGTRPHAAARQDTAGQERFHALGPIYYRDSQGAVLVYDIADEDSFQKVKSWVKELRTILGTDVVLAIVGNKIDLEKNRVVPLSTAEQYAASVGARHYQVSAKLNKGIEDLMLDMAKRTCLRADAAAACTHAAHRPRRAGMLQASNARTTAPISARASTIIVDDDSDVKRHGGAGGRGGSCC